MMIDAATKRKLIIIFIALVAVIVLAIFVQRQAQSLASISPEYNSSRGEDGAPEAVPSLYLTNGDEFREKFEINIQTSILNAIYQKNYEIYGTINRTAEIKGGISVDKEQVTSFTVLMGEQKQPLNVWIHIDNAATNDYSITVEKGTS